jgi:diketogulonate reductase-like aldo/keto reductase
MVAPRSLQDMPGYCTGLVECVTLNNGVQMPKMAYGTYGSSLGWWNVKKRAHKGVQDWIAAGGRGIDTAQLYEDQVQVGTGTRSSGVARKDLFIETKCSGAMGYYAIIECLQDNLVMLDMEYVDLLLIHFPEVPKPECMLDMPPPFCGAEERTMATNEQLKTSWLAMELIYKSGKARAIGLSDYPLDKLLVTVANAKIKPAVLQTLWSPIYPDFRLLDLCRRNGIQLQACGVLGGLVKMEGNRLTSSNNGVYTNGDVLGNRLIMNISKAHAVSPAEVSLAWTLQKGVAAVVATFEPEHMSKHTSLRIRTSAQDGC